MDRVLFDAARIQSVTGQLYITEVRNFAVDAQDQPVRVFRGSGFPFDPIWTDQVVRISGRPTV